MPDDVLSPTSTKPDHVYTHVSNNISSTEGNFLLRSVVYPSPPSGEANIYLSHEANGIMQSNNSVIVKFCEACHKIGDEVQLKLFQINEYEAMYICPQKECQFPLLEDDVNSYIISHVVGKLMSLYEDKTIFQQGASNSASDKSKKFHSDNLHSDDSPTTNKFNKISDDNDDDDGSLNLASSKCRKFNFAVLHPNGCPTTNKFKPFCKDDDDKTEVGDDDDDDDDYDDDDGIKSKVDSVENVCTLSKELEAFNDMQKKQSINSEIDFLEPEEHYCWSYSFTKSTSNNLKTNSKVNDAWLTSLDSRPGDVETSPGDLSMSIDDADICNEDKPAKISMFSTKNMFINEANNCIEGKTEKMSTLHSKKNMFINDAGKCNEDKRDKMSMFSTKNMLFNQANNCIEGKTEKISTLHSKKNMFINDAGKCNEDKPEKMSIFSTKNMLFNQANNCIEGKTEKMSTMHSKKNMFINDAGKCNEDKPEKMSMFSTKNIFTSDIQSQIVSPNLQSVPRYQQMLQWKNERNLCWLDVLLHCFVHNACVRKTLNHKLRFEERSTNIFYKVCTVYDSVQEQFNKLLDKSVAKTGTTYDKATVVSRLDNIRTEIFECLQRQFLLKPGTHESVMEMFSNMLSLSPHLKDIFLVQLRWEFHCEVCSYKMVRRSTTDVISFLSTNVDFHPLHATFSRSCFKCSSRHQIMNMIMEIIPPCLMMHFQHGLPHNHFKVWDFGIQEHLYSITAIVQYITKPFNHFIIWIRDGKKNKWMCCNDLENAPCKWKRESPKIPPEQIHMIMWENQGDIYSPGFTECNSNFPMHKVSNHDAMLSSDEFPPEISKTSDLQSIILDDDNITEAMFSDSTRKSEKKTFKKSTDSNRKLRTIIQASAGYNSLDKGSQTWIHEENDKMDVEVEKSITETPISEVGSGALSNETLSVVDMDTSSQNILLYVDDQKLLKNRTLRMPVSNVTIDLTYHTTEASKVDNVKLSAKRSAEVTETCGEIKRIKSISVSRSGGCVTTAVKCPARTFRKRVTRSTSTSPDKKTANTTKTKKLAPPKLKNRAITLPIKSNKTFMKKEISMLNQVSKELNIHKNTTAKAYTDAHAQTNIDLCSGTTLINSNTLTATGIGTTSGNNSYDRPCGFASAGVKSLTSSTRTEPIPAVIDSSRKVCVVSAGVKPDNKSSCMNSIPAANKEVRNPMSTLNAVGFRNLSSNQGRMSTKLLNGTSMFESYKPKRAFKLAGYKKAKLKPKKSDALVQAPYFKRTDTEQSSPTPFESSERSNGLSDVLSRDFNCNGSYSDGSVASTSHGNATSDYSSFLGSHLVTPNSTPSRTTDDDFDFDLLVGNGLQPSTGWLETTPSIHGSISNTQTSTSVEDLIDDLDFDSSFVDNLNSNLPPDLNAPFNNQYCNSLNSPSTKVHVTGNGEDLLFFESLDEF